MQDIRNKRVLKLLKWIKVVAIVSTVVVALILVDLKTPFGGNIRFYSEWVRCDERPIEGSSLIGGHIEYYQQAPAGSLWRGANTVYYCTALDAERAGLSADPHVYRFPELEKRNETLKIE